MTYTEHGKEVVLQMTVDDYARLLLMLSLATRAVNDDPPKFWRSIAFLNELNRTNPEFIPYEIPARYH